MHPADRGPYGLLGCVGVFTVAATLALAVAAFPGRPWSGLAVGVMTCALFAAPIAWGLRRTRLRTRLDPMPLRQADAHEVLHVEVPGAGTLRADAQGLHVPRGLVTRQADRRAREAGQDDVLVAWGDVVRWQVLPAMGTPHGQHVLDLAGDAPLRRLGVIRQPALRAHDDTILAFARVRVRCAIEIRDAI